MSKAFITLKVNERVCPLCGKHYLTKRSAKKCTQSHIRNFTKKLDLLIEKAGEDLRNVIQKEKLIKKDDQKEDDDQRSQKNK